jgi:hypothetical protein
MRREELPLVQPMRSQPERDILSAANQAKRRRHYPNEPSLAQRTADPDEVMMPRKVIVCLEGGMQRYIPLTLLTTKACYEASYTAAMDKDMKHSLKLEDGNLRMTPASFDATGEDKISVTDWTDATTRYVMLLGRHLLAGSDTYPGGSDAQKIAAEWEGHFSLIKKRTNFLERFHTYRKYDIMVRRMWQSQLASPEQREAYMGSACNQVISPNVWHDDLYRRIIDDDVYAQLGQQGSATSTVSGLSTTGHSSQGSSSSFTTRSRHASSDKGRPKRSGADETSSIKCMYCGKKDHHYRRCRGAEGLPIQRNKEKQWCDKDGRTYCIGYNGPSPCTHGEACVHLHACSICLARDHGAQRCSVR